MSNKDMGNTGQIATNRKAFHDYAIEDRFEAGMVLEGWEVKAIRSGHINLKDSYVRIKNGEVWLIGCHISALISASSHVIPDTVRDKKLLLSNSEISRLIVKVEQKGYSLIVLNLHFKRGRIKAEIALARGKKLYDKRASLKEREQKRETAQALKAARN